MKIDLDEITKEQMVNHFNMLMSGDISRDEFNSLCGEIIITEIDKEIEKKFRARNNT